MSTACRILTMRTAWRKRKRGGKAARTSPEKEGGRGDAKMGEGENITPRVPVIRTRARDDNAKIPGHRRRFCPPVFPWLAFLRFLVIFTPPTTTLPFLRPLDIALFFSSTYDAGACLIFARSRRLQLWRNLPTADTVEERKGKEKEIEF